LGFGIRDLGFEMSIPALGLDTFIAWVFRTVATAAEAELNDDSVLREQLLEAEMRREMGEITDTEYAEVEADLLQRIREIKERKAGGAGPLEFGAEAVEKGDDERFQIEATLSGDFYEPSTAAETSEPTKPSTTKATNITKRKRKKP
jgi:hypothetical protein